MFYILAESTNDSSLVTQLGVGGIFVILVLRLVFDFINKQKNNGTNKMVSQVSQLHKWHEPDQEGEQSWKNKQLIEVVKEIKNESLRGTKAIENNTRLIERLMPVLNKIERKVNI